MAQRRMISRELHESPDFESMSIAACFALDQIHLYADDDGYIKIADALYRGRCSADVIEEIKEAGWIEINNNIIKVLEWTAFQSIKKDRYVPSQLKKYFAGKQPYKPHFPEKADHITTSEELSKNQQGSFFNGYDPETDRKTSGFRSSGELFGGRKQFEGKRKRGGAKQEWQSNCARWIKKVGTFKDEDIPIIYKAWGDSQGNQYALERIMVDIMELKPKNPIAYFNDLYGKLKKNKK